MGCGKIPNLRYYPGIFLERKEIHENLQSG
jgi:hypothetical protein